MFKMIVQNTVITNSPMAIGNSSIYGHTPVTQALL